jgi:Flp pilus assembly secretin CpaC
MMRLRVRPARHSTGSNMRRIAFALALAMTAATPLTAAAQSRSMEVEIDRVQRVQLRGAASSVIVANPDVADVTVVDASTLFITGRGFGSTELVVVDAIGRTLFQTVVNVTSPAEGHVRVWRGGQSVDMACGASCTPSQRQAPAPDGAP